MSNGISFNADSDSTVLQGLLDRIPTFPQIPTVGPGVTEEDVQAAKEQYAQAVEEFSLIKEELEASIEAAVSPVKAQLDGLHAKIDALQAQIAPLSALPAIGGLSISSMTGFATNVTGSINALLNYVAGPSIASLQAIAGQLPDMASSVGSINSMVGQIQAKLPSGVSLAVPALPTLPALPSIPSLPHV